MISWLGMLRRQRSGSRVGPILIPSSTEPSWGRRGLFLVSVLIANRYRGVTDRPCQEETRAMAVSYHDTSRSLLTGRNHLPISGSFDSCMLSAIMIFFFSLFLFCFICGHHIGEMLCRGLKMDRSPPPHLPS